MIYPRRPPVGVNDPPVVDPAESFLTGDVDDGPARAVALNHAPVSGEVPPPPSPAAGQPPLPLDRRIPPPQVLGAPEVGVGPRELGWAIDLAVLCTLGSRIGAGRTRLQAETWSSARANHLTRMASPP